MWAPQKLASWAVLDDLASSADRSSPWATQRPRYHRTDHAHHMHGHRAHPHARCGPHALDSVCTIFVCETASQPGEHVNARVSAAFSGHFGLAAFAALAMLMMPPAEKHVASNSESLGAFKEPLKHLRTATCSR